MSDLRPAFTYEASEKLDVWAFVPGGFPDESLSPDGQYEPLGSTRGWFGLRRAVEVPAHIRWGVRGRFADVIAPLERQRIPGVDLLWDATLGDAQLEKLAAFEWLEDLGLPAWSAVTDKGLEHVARLENLRALDLHGSFGITDAGLAHVGKLSKLRHLNISYELGVAKQEQHEVAGEPRVALTSAGLAHLRGLRDLQVLEARGAWVTDEGLKHLEALESLRVLSLYDIDKDESPTSEAAREAFKKARPRCEVIEW